MNNISKRLDRFLGIPLLFTLGGLEKDRKFKLDDTAKSAGILCLSSSRDIIMALPLLADLRYKYPQCKITIFTSEENMAVASMVDTVNIVRLYPSSRTKSAEIVRAYSHFDIWIDLGVWSRFEAIISIKARAKYKIGFRMAGEMRHFAYDRVVEYNPTRHRAENILNLGSLLGIQADKDLTQPAISQHIYPKSKSIVINMFCDNVKEINRQWPFDNWKILTENLIKKGYKISLIGSKANVADADKFVESLSSNADVDYLVGRIDIHSLQKLLRENALLVSIDAVPLYLARHIGSPVLGIFGPTYPQGTYFNKGENEAVTANINCVGCQNRYGDEACATKIPGCMITIHPATIEERIIKICEATE